LPEWVNKHSCSVLIITNHTSLGLALTRSAQSVVEKHSPVFSITYTETMALLTPSRIKETDFFIMELLRTYPGGQRAEGVVLAERLIYRKPFLIVSPLHLAQKIQCPGYWDTEAKDSPVDRIRGLLNFPHQCTEGFERMKANFSRMMELPPQH